jgi:hypothetical protein
VTTLRWLTAVTVFAITLAVGVTVAGRVEPDYQAQGSMVLLGPSEKLVNVETNETEPVNPYAELTPKLETMATVIAHAVTEGRTAHEFEQRGHRYTVEVEGPVILVDAVNRQPQAAIATVLTVFAAVERELRVRQDRLGSPANLHITGEVLAAPAPAAKTTIDRDRAVAATIALGGVAAFAVAALVDRLNTARQRRAEARMRRAPVRTPPRPGPPTPPPAAKPQAGTQAPAPQTQAQPGTQAPAPQRQQTFWVPGRTRR